MQLLKLLLIVCILTPAAVNSGPVVLNFLSGTICPEVADNFSGSTNSESYGQHYPYVLTLDVCAIRSAKQKGKSKVECEPQDLNAINLLRKRRRQELCIRMLQL